MREAFVRLGMMLACIAGYLLYVSAGATLAEVIPLLFVAIVLLVPAALLTLALLLPLERKVAATYGALVYLAMPVISGLIGASAFLLLAGLRLDAAVLSGAMVYGVIGLVWGGSWMVSRAIYHGMAGL